MASGGKELSRTREEKERQQQPDIYATHIVLHSQDLQQLIGHQEQRPTQPLWGVSTIKQEDPQPPFVKEEEEELQITQEGFPRREESDLSKSPLTGVSVKTEDHEDKPDCQQLIDNQEHLCQTQWGNSTLKQEDPQHSNIKQEEAEFWITREGEYLLGEEEADPLTGVSVKTEDHEDKPLESLQLHYHEENAGSCISPQHMTTEADGGSQTNKTNPSAPLSDSDDTMSHSPEDEDRDVTQEPLSSDPDWEGDMRTHTDKKRSGKKRGKRPAIICHHQLHSFCKAKSLNRGDIDDIFEALYHNSDKERQDAFVAAHIILSPVVRRRASNQVKRERNYSPTFYITTQSGEKVEVCSATFHSIFALGRKRVGNIMKFAWANNSHPRPEQRGGARENFRAKEVNVLIKAHIKSFRCCASHYGRDKRYLPSSLSIHRMSELYNEEHPDHQASYTTYWRVFVNNFNLGFGSPTKGQDLQ
uniref:uncharacterized protein LOC131128112 isoform X2 n=1 Tax=Doryrhamphus excisus TaxID=161450 RepID=UPI0025ADA1B9|nr:uncharacterized protein LOC131128112 isoform X2 [Doryrhamphus excisus]